MCCLNSFGVIGIGTHVNSGSLLKSGLIYSIHRGQHNFGIILSNKNGLQIYNSESLEGIFNDIILCDVNLSYGFVSNEYVNEPHHFRFSRYGEIVISVIGQISNKNEIYQKILTNNIPINKGTSEEIIFYLLHLSKSYTLIDAIKDCFTLLEGTFLLTIITKQAIFIIKKGIIPIVIGKLDNTFLFSSETSVIEGLGGEIISDLNSNEILCLEQGIKKIRVNEVESKLCSFELLSLANSNSFLGGKNIYLLRKELGRQLAKELQINLDTVISCSENSIPYALGYAQHSKVMYDLGIIEKYGSAPNYIKNSLENKKVLLIDSYISNNTQYHINRLIKMGIKSLTIGICSPKYMTHCKYSKVDNPQPSIINHTVFENLSICYLSLEGYRFILNSNDLSDFFCIDCFTGGFNELSYKF